MTKPEPLKGKKMKIIDFCIDEVKYADAFNIEMHSDIEGNKHIVYHKDIKYAVEWLKDNVCHIYKSGYVETLLKGQDLLNKIDEAFEDVIEK